MNELEIEQIGLTKIKNDPNQRGSAIIIAVFILVLLSTFVALALSRTASEAAAVGNETTEARTFYAAQGSLEMMTRNFNKVFEVKLSPADTDFNSLRSAGVPGFTTAQYTFNQEVDLIRDSVYTPIDRGAYAGLYATQDNWRLRTTATDATRNIQVQLTRNILNNRIPIFQFGIFYNDDLEFHPGPRFDFGGRVHSNGSLFLMAQTGLYFTSRVSTVGEIITDTGRNGKPYTQWGENVFIKKGASNVQLKHDMGSVVKTPANGVPRFADTSKPTLYNLDMPTEYANANWAANEANFGGNLLARQPALDLPLKIASLNNNQVLDYIELIKRGKSVGDLFYDKVSNSVKPVLADQDKDSIVTAGERYYNKTGIRINLADSKAKLPGCASGTGTDAKTEVCGKRLDGDAMGDNEGAVSSPRGYQPLSMRDSYQATRINGERFGTTGAALPSRQVWIKIELVKKDETTGTFITDDVTADFLSLGVTEAAPFPITDYPTTTDTRSIIKLQRFTTERVSPTYSAAGVKVTPTDTSHMTYSNVNGTNYNIVLVEDRPTNNGVATGTGVWTARDNAFVDNPDHYKTITAPSSGTGFERHIVPFPIEMFDSREGVYNADINFSTTYGTNVPWAGVMSMLDIDVANFKRFLDGEFDTTMRTSGTKYSDAKGHALRNSPTDPSKNDVPQNGGWVVYVSDRRGDGDFDGEYDMEDIYGNNDNVMQKGEDVNGNGILDRNYTSEAVRYTGAGSMDSPARAASVDHPYYRRGVRLINAQRLPGQYNAADASKTRGFTVASENGIYVFGDYNASSIASVGTPTPWNDYRPNDFTDVPASIVSDAVTILSNNWADSKSFLSPFTTGGSNPREATETHTRFAILSGDSLSSYEATPNQGGSDPRLGGGVHNFKRFLEDWSGIRLNYCGSLINLFNAHNNNGSFKSSSVVYNPPNRNWVFDSSFLDPNRLPPGTPYFQYIQTTGFQRTND